jgi:LmbE family N-acetylglucosaminyl deacetylase
VVELLLALALGWARSLFTVAGARRVESLPAALGAHSLVALFAHPDDEIKVAGLLADAGARGDVAHLVTAARGDGGIAEGIARADLPRVREAEVRRHGAALGLAGQEVWSYGDGELGKLPPGELQRRFEEKLRAWRPDLVLTFDPASGYTAHVDHLAVGAAATAAFCAVARQPGGPRWLVYALAPPGVARRFGGERGRLVAERQPPAQFAIAVAPAVKVRAWDIHASQRGYVRRFAHLPPWLLYRLFDEELYAARSADEACR